MIRNLNIITRKAERKPCRVCWQGSLPDQGSRCPHSEHVHLRALRSKCASPLHAASGSRVQISLPRISAFCDGVIRWSHNGRVGIQFDPNSNARAQVASYFRFFHQRCEAGSGAL